MTAHLRGSLRGCTLFTLLWFFPLGFPGKVFNEATKTSEVSNHLDKPPEYLYACSIRMSLMPTFNRRHHSSWQIYSRHWVVRADDAVVGDVDGESVLIKNPLLKAEEEEFVYRGISKFPTTNLSLDGSFTFVPGSLKDPKGNQFEVNVAEFPVKLPDYIF
ncbi:hypothetical protein Bca4012_038463 [Brassica carinata]